MVLAVGDCVQFREEVRSTLAEVVEGQKEAQAEAIRILDSQTVREAQQLLLGRQVGGEEEFFLSLFVSFFIFQFILVISIVFLFLCLLASLFQYFITSTLLFQCFFLSLSFSTSLKMYF